MKYTILVLLALSACGADNSRPMIQRRAAQALVAPLPANCSNPTVIEGNTYCCCRYDIGTNRCQRIVNVDLAPESCR
jgi:hypothetical protein